MTEEGEREPWEGVHVELRTIESKRNATARSDDSDLQRGVTRSRYARRQRDALVALHDMMAYSR